MTRKKRKPLKLLTVPAERTDQDFAESAESRQRIANKQTLMLAEAISHCGANATAYARWEIHDRYLPAGSPPAKVIYCCRRPNHVGWFPTHEFEGCDETMGPPLQGFHREGEKFKDEGYLFPFRYEVRIRVLDEYHPVSAEELKAAAEKKCEKIIAENARRVAAEEEWQRKNVPPSLFEDPPSEGETV